jgi:hypothetical protein
MNKPNKQPAWKQVPISTRQQDLLVTEWLTRQSQCDFDFDESANPCGGGVEYLHRDPASRRRRRKGKSQIWDSKIWSRVPRDSDPRKTALARPAAYIRKRQARPLIREGAPQKQDRICQTVRNILIDWPSVAMWLWLNFDLAKKSSGEFLVEFRGSMVIEQEMARRLHSDSSASFCVEIHCQETSQHRES